MEQTDRDFLDGYDRIRLKLPTGTEIEFKPPPLSEAARFMRLLADLTNGNYDALVEIVETFPKSIDCVKECEALLPGEVIGLLKDFFAFQREPRTDSPTMSENDQKPHSWTTLEQTERAAAEPGGLD